MSSTRNGGMLLGASALGGAAIIFGMVLTRALVSAPAAEGTSAPTADEMASAFVAAAEQDNSPRAPLITLEQVQLAAQSAPFDPDRRPSDERYQLPGEEIEIEAPPPAPEHEPEPAPDFELIGTAAGPNGGVVVIRLENGTPQLLTVGDQLGGYRVASIGDGQAQMAGRERTANLIV